jgi:hypothetical protein
MGRNVLIIHRITPTTIMAIKIESSDIMIDFELNSNVSRFLPASVT